MGNWIGKNVHVQKNVNNKAWGILNGFVAIARWMWDTVVRWLSWWLRKWDLDRDGFLHPIQLCSVEWASHLHTRDKTYPAICPQKVRVNTPNNQVCWIAKWGLIFHRNLQISTLYYLFSVVQTHAWCVVYLRVSEWVGFFLP